MEDRLMRLPEVLRTVSIGKSKWYAGLREGIFPKPVRLGRSVAWKASDIAALVENGVGQAD